MAARALKVAVQMDPIQSVDIDADSTFALMLEAQARGHALWHYHVRDLAFAAGRVVARAQPVVVERKRGAHWRFGEEEELDLDLTEVVAEASDGEAVEAVVVTPTVADVQIGRAHV